MKYLCFDIESCDGGRNGSLCSFGYCIADENFNIIEQDDILVNPNKPFNKRLFGSVIKLAYTEEVFRSAPRFPLVYDRIKSLFSEDVVVLGFSIINDVNYVSDAIRTYKLPQIYYEYYDVQLMYGIYKKESRNYSLAAAAEEFGIEFLEHRSVDDAVATLKVLQGILKTENKTFDQFVEEYGVMPGLFGKGSCHNCYTDVVYSGIDYTSEKTKKRLLNEFLLSLPRGKKTGLPFSHKVVCFDEDLELNDVSLTRDRIAKLYELGGRYSSGVESSNVLVYNDKDTARYKYAQIAPTGHRLKFMTVQEFLEALGEVPRNQYDDAAILRAGNRRRRLSKERAAERNHSAQKQAGKKPVSKQPSGEQPKPKQENGGKRQSADKQAAPQPEAKKDTEAKKTAPKKPRPRRKKPQPTPTQSTDQNKHSCTRQIFRRH